MNIYDKTHPHHAVWREAVESVLAGVPKIVEYRCDNSNWYDIDTVTDGMPIALWLPCYQYRIKSVTKKLVVNGVTYEYPMPFSGEIKVNQIYYVVEVGNINYRSAQSYVNYGNSFVRDHIASGLVHLIKENAEQHAKVIHEIFKL